MIIKINKIALLLICFLLFNCFAEEQELYRIKIGREGTGYINNKGELIIPPIFSTAYAFENGIAAAEKENVWYYINNKGEILFSIPNVDHIGPFSEDLAVVTKYDFNNKTIGYQGYIDQKGKIVITTQFRGAESFKNGLAVVTYDLKEYFYINKKGEDVFNKRFITATDFNEGYAVVAVIDRVKEKNFALIDKKGNFISLPKGYTFHTEEVKNNYIILKNDGLYIFWNPTTGEIKDSIKGYVPRILASNMYSIVDPKTGLYGVVSLQGKVILPCVYEYLKPLDDGFIYFEEKEYGGFLDQQGSVVIPSNFYLLSPFKGDMANFFPPSGFDGGYVRRDGKVFKGKDYLP